MFRIMPFWLIDTAPKLNTLNLSSPYSGAEVSSKLKFCCLAGKKKKKKKKAVHLVCGNRLDVGVTACAKHQQ